MIVVTGPGRSGTSLVAQLYRELGFDPGGRWHDDVRARLATGSEPLAAAHDGFVAVAGTGDSPAGGPAWLTRLREVDDLFLVASVDRAALPADVVADLAGALGPRGWAVSLQETKLIRWIFYFAGICQS